ncbi:MAG: FtsX-like permease family protein [Pseudomonadota bacterium]
MGISSYISSRFTTRKFTPSSIRAVKILTVIGIVLAITTLTLSMCISSGFEKEYKRALLGFNAHIAIFGSGSYFNQGEIEQIINRYRYDDEDKAFQNHNRVLLSLYMKLAPLIDRAFGNNDIVKKMLSQRKKGVVGVSPFIYREGLAIAGGEIVGTILKGVDLDEWRKERPVKFETNNGSQLKVGVMVGRPLFKKLGSPSTIKFIFPTKKGEEKTISIDVDGVFETGLYDFDSQFVLMDMDALRKLFDISKGDVTGLEVMLDDPDKAKAIAFDFERSTDNEYRALTWEEVNSELFEAIGMEKKVFAIIMGLLVVVAAFNIIALTMLMILHRRYDIALFKSLGMPSDMVRHLFLFSGVKVGILGTSLGAALSVLIAFVMKRLIPFHLDEEIYFLDKLPISISPMIILLVSFFSLLVCFVTSWAAAKQEGRIDVCKALQEK